MAILLTSMSLSGQTLPEAAPLNQPAAAAATVSRPDPSEATSPATSPSAVQQRVASYDPNLRSGSQELSTAAEADPQTLHLLLGRSLFINTVERMRRVYISNPNVLDSLTASPTQLVITAKAAGSSSVVLWNEWGQSSMYTVLADLDVAGLNDSLAQALPGDHVDVKAAQGRVYLSGVVGSDAAVEEAVRLASDLFQGRGQLSGGRSAAQSAGGAAGAHRRTGPHQVDPIRLQFLQPRTKCRRGHHPGFRRRLPFLKLGEGVRRR